LKVEYMVSSEDTPWNAFIQCYLVYIYNSIHTISYNFI
jgi:hypothetical protein